ncbi:hypothetical protein PT974_01241 [Cladobotryum mycophilum]|uniref:Alpha/beta hydrolase fold-3 domain-containing protein n=1 Tax=Cladobotryum mycophilum TaxID=491253 RepID=A0ABR0T3E1_9HYPO
MHIASKPQLSIWEKLQLTWKILVLTPPRLVLHCAQLFSFAATRGLSLRQYFICAQVRIFFSLTGRQLQYLLPSGAETYKAWVEKKRKTSQDPAILDRLAVDIQPIPGRQANILWLGNRKTAKKAVLFFHGGGYIIPLTAAHVEWCWSAYVSPALETGSTEIAVAILQYNLAPGAKFPSQLHDAVASLPVLFDSGFQPKDIIVGGDSAGGHLTMLLHHHLLHPHPEVPALQLKEPFMASFVVSPWLNLDTNTPAFKRNERSDMLSVNICNSLAKDVITEELAAKIKRSSNETDAWALNPFGVEVSWLRDLANVTPKLYITVGNEEVLLDSSLDLVQKLKKANTSVDVVLEAEDGEAHDWILVEAFNEQIGSATKRMRAWIRQVTEY